MQRIRKKWFYQSNAQALESLYTLIVGLFTFTNGKILMKRLNSVIKFLRLGVILLGLSLTLPVSGGDIYSYRNDDGVLVYTNKLSTRQVPAKVHKPTARKTNTVSTVKVFRFVDSKGVVHLTDKPKHSRYKLIYQSGASVSPFSSSLENELRSELSDIDKSPSSPLHRKHKNYKALIQDVATSVRLEPALLHAVIQTESAYNPRAVSPKGAVGLMQLMPGTAKRFGVRDRTDATSNVYGGARYLRYLLKMFRNNMRLALAAYNAGENAVKRYGNKIPPYRETKNYVAKVMRLYKSYRKRM